METSIIVIVISTFTALNGVLFQPKKDPEKKISWSNVNKWGKLLLTSIFILGLVSSIQIIQTNKKTKIKEKKLKVEKEEQKDFNNYLIKVASVCDGYTSIIRGTLDFEKAPTEAIVRSTLQNMFFKYLQCEILASNKFGNFKAKLFNSSQPYIKRFLNLRIETPRSDFIKNFESSRYQNPFFFELSFDKVKLINENEIMFAKHGQSEVYTNIEKTSYADDFSRLYGIKSIFITEIVINDYKPISINKIYEFR